MSHKLLSMFVVLVCGLSGGHSLIAAGLDGRIPVRLDAGESNLVRTEMRHFLASVQAIVSGVAEHDLKRVISGARSSGKAAGHAVPKTLKEKLPEEFRRIGSNTHKRFDRLAMDVEQMEDPGLALEQLGELMQNCVACHAAYRIEVE